ncbi:uncharacterized protein LY89DRAFT_771771 [Mollisia scopiformis]|uniref:RING-type domain-containing protein n=1 Tax=Mollisia scopiformis TaxID=149040 RepID=A0A194XLW0_MOLSC|nr:uncharacterized protein LY89DRAFT_771771 [Mollisia scopiformis]KUJ20752.1 hypothetical protein LY89DRAFT_771771 [Mollisia scopiformis]
MSTPYVESISRTSYETLILSQSDTNKKLGRLCTEQQTLVRALEKKLAIHGITNVSGRPDSPDHVKDSSEPELSTRHTTEEAEERYGEFHAEFTKTLTAFAHRAETVLVHADTYKENKQWNGELVKVQHHDWVPPVPIPDSENGVVEQFFEYNAIMLKRTPHFPVGSGNSHPIFAQSRLKATSESVIGSLLFSPQNNMCQTSYFTFWALCGHSTLEDNRCDYRDCTLPSPTRSIEQHQLCRSCATNPASSYQQPPNHQQNWARTARELAVYRQAEIFAEQQLIEALDQERREEELALARVSTYLMTLDQAQRIRFLYKSLTDGSRDEIDVSEIHSERLRVLRRAMFNVPSRFMNDWKVQDLTAHTDALINDTNARAQKNLLEFEEFHLIQSTLTLGELGAMSGQMMNDRTLLSRDYATYLDLTLLIHERKEQDRLQEEINALQAEINAEERHRLQAISRLLELVSISTLPNGEFDQRCTICMETYGVLTDDGVVEQPTRLPCGHVCGTTCLTKWFMENDTCGFCRRNYWAELGSAPPPQMAQSEDELPDYVDEDEEMADFADGSEEGEIVERHNGEIVLSPAPFESFFSDTGQANYQEPVNSDDDNPFMAWGMSSEEDLSTDDSPFDVMEVDEMMRLLDYDEDQGEPKPIILTPSRAQEDCFGNLLDEIGFHRVPPPWARF